MTQSQLLTGRFREVILEGTWIANTNYKHQLAQLDWKLATQKVGELNTIYVLARHIHYYINGLNEFFATGKLSISDRFAFDFPELTGDADWQAFLSTFWADAEQFATNISAFSDEQLASVFVDERYGAYQRNIEAMIEHAYYHLGQISLIGKMLTAVYQQ